MNAGERAKAWRIERKLTPEQLADLSGYCLTAIYGFERGERGPGKPHSDFAWERYRLVCAGIDRQLRTGRRFEW